MSKIELNVKGAYQVVKTFCNDRKYIEGQAIDIKSDKLVSELSMKGLIEKREVKIQGPAKPKRAPRKNGNDKK